jgi:rhodanese-related sulfurtransferase
MPKKIFRITVEALIIAVAAAAVAFASNAARSDGIALIQDEKGPAITGVVKIDLTKAKELFDAGKAIFIDARDDQAYKTGHIRGARNLPYERYEELFVEVLGDLDEKKDAVVIYCDGADCNASDILATQMRNDGYTTIYVFFGGWEAWVTTGHPTNSDLAAKPLYKLD